MSDTRTYTVFVGLEQQLSAPLPDLLHFLSSREATLPAPVLIFDDHTGRTVDFNLRGTAQEVLARAQEQTGQLPAQPARTGPGRPRLGVVSREISLLPRHWDWLETQRGGASATLRRLVDEARKGDAAEDEVRQAQAAADRVLSVLAGDLAGYEAASRALYAADLPSFLHHSEGWPPDVQAYALRLAAPVFGQSSEAQV